MSESTIVRFGLHFYQSCCCFSSKSCQFLFLSFQKPFTWWSTQSSHADVHTFIHYFMSLTSLKFTNFLLLSSFKVFVNCLRAWSISYFQFYLCSGDTLSGDKQGSWQKDEPTHDSTNLLKAEKIPVAKNIKAFSTLSKLLCRFHFGSFVAFGFGFQKHFLSKRDRPHEQPIAAPGMRWFSFVDATLTCRSSNAREMFKSQKRIEHYISGAICFWR